MNYISLSQARKEWAKLLDYVATKKEPVYITRHGHPVAVIVPMDTVVSGELPKGVELNDKNQP